MDVFGSFALILAFICAVYAFGGGIAAILTRHPLWSRARGQAVSRDMLPHFLATFGLEYLFFRLIISPSLTSSLIAIARYRLFTKGCRPLGRAGRFIALLELPAFYLRFLQS